MDKTKAELEGWTTIKNLPCRDGREDPPEINPQFFRVHNLFALVAAVWEPPASKAYKRRTMIDEQRLRRMAESGIGVPEFRTALTQVLDENAELKKTIKSLETEIEDLEYQGMGEDL